MISLNLPDYRTRSICVMYEVWKRRVERGEKRLAGKQKKKNKIILVQVKQNRLSYS